MAASSLAQANALCGQAESACLGRRWADAVTLYRAAADKFKCGAEYTTDARAAQQLNHLARCQTLRADEIQLLLERLPPPVPLAPETTRTVPVSAAVDAVVHGVGSGPARTVEDFAQKRSQDTERGSIALARESADGELGDQADDMWGSVLRTTLKMLPQPDPIKVPSAMRTTWDPALFTSYMVVPRPAVAAQAAPTPEAAMAESVQAVAGTREAAAEIERLRAQLVLARQQQQQLAQENEDLRTRLRAAVDYASHCDKTSQVAVRKYDQLCESVSAFRQHVQERVRTERASVLMSRSRGSATAPSASVEELRRERDSLKKEVTRLRERQQLYNAVAKQIPVRQHDAGSGAGSAGQDTSAGSQARAAGPP